MNGNRNGTSLQNHISFHGIAVRLLGLREGEGMGHEGTNIDFVLLHRITVNSNVYVFRTIVAGDHAALR